ncbi:hypothetical protein [Anianabacter salinae]|uniref:hypothetical protein n=1 Tax=Anianabacter salinae TaxID=2851023 RepID=UPI00225E1DAC|nr:hypothetical protein [Anianabacter salinae]MBV0911289.1 hypothetical protein [Anianabacter salinae]
MLDTLKKYLAEDSGAMTVDFVVVTAGVVGLGMAVVITLADHILDISNVVEDEIQTGISVQTYAAQTD